MKAGRRLGERRSVSERSCLELLVILVALLIGELIWVVLFTFIAVWLRRL